ncbi:MAG: hypothetical protein ACH34Y_07100 [Brachymonas sp.]|jgi:hypothetical protein
MDNPATTTPISPYTRFSGLAEWRSALLAFLQRAAAEKWPKLMFCDSDFSLWPLNDTEILAALENWSHRPNSFTIIAADYRHIERNFPRFIQWRRQWDHIVHAHTPAPVHSGSLPHCILAAPHSALHILDPVRCRGIALYEAHMVHDLELVLDEILLKASSAFPASTTGL